LRDITVEITGTTGLVMHSVDMANPTNLVVKQIKALTSKRAKDKTDEDQEAIAKLEFLGGLYYEDGELYVPTWNVIRSFENAGRQWRLGSAVIRALTVTEGRVRLEIDGPHDPEALWQDKRYVWTTLVGVQRNKTLRTRPIFRVWSLRMPFVLDEEVMDFETLERIVQRAGKVEGLGDARKLGRGRYTAKLV
jgi:hypothetical protein